MRKGMSKRVISLVVLATVMSTTMVQAAEISKDESVFVNLGVDGKYEKTVVSNWIHSGERNLIIKDKSQLDNIKNVKGDEYPSKDEDNLEWKVEGGEVYYQGTTNKELPLDILIKYYLDGKEIKGEDLAGKSGRVRIEIQVKNKVYKEININGKNRKVYTPFTTIALTTLPVDKFSNVIVDGGALISEGNNNIATGIVFPGLSESLGLSDLGIEMPIKDEFTIEANVKEFSLGPIMFTATPELPDLSKLDSATTITDLKDSLEQLKNGADKLVDGTSQIKDGINLAKNKLDEGTALVKNSSVQEKLSLIKSDSQVNKANKLMDDAFFAKDLNADKAKELLTFLSDENLSKVDTLVGDFRVISGHKDMLAAVINATEGLSKDDSFNKLISDAIVAKNKYDEVDATTKEKLLNLSGLATGKNIAGIQNVIKDSVAVKDGINPLMRVIDGYIQASPGNSNYEKTNNFLFGIGGQLQVVQNLLSENTMNSLNSLSNDMNGYASSYLVIKGQLAYSLQQGGIDAFNTKKAELAAVIDGVYGGNGAEVKAYISSLTPEMCTADALRGDAAKINNYKDQLPQIIGAVDSLKGLKPLIDSSVAIVGNETTRNNIAKLLTELKDENVQSLITAFEEGIISLTPEDLQGIEDVLQALKTISADIENNKGNIDSINRLLNELSNSSELIDEIRKFKEDLAQSQDVVDNVVTMIGGLNGEDIAKVKDLSNELLLMQNDLKESEDILRITKDALSKGNIDRARNLIASLPQLQVGINTLVKGSIDLNSGMKTFSEDGINKLYTKGNDKILSVEDVLVAKDELIKASKEFNTFTGKSDEMKGSVKFIMKTNEIKEAVKVEEKKEEVKTEEKGFWAWIKKIFHIGD